MPRSPYPLQWPPGSKRTKPAERKYSRFGSVGAYSKQAVSPYEAAKQIHTELERLGASHIVITSMLPTRHDGLPYADGRADKDDTGVAVWCVYEGRERVFACDRWMSPGENMRAIALSIEAMRGLDRWGMADATEKVFAGFAALPAGEQSGPVKRNWREVLGETFGAWPEGVLERDELLVLAKSRHRKLIANHHPDRGGDPAKAAELNIALEEATAELSS